MRVVVVGATGNVGTSVVELLRQDGRVDSVVGVARRRPTWQPTGVQWLERDVVTMDLDDAMSGADAVIHLAWAFQPSHRPAATWDVNVVGTCRVLEAVARAGIGVLVVASSVAAYSPADKTDKTLRVDESWPTHGWPQAAYCREKSYVERVLDHFELAHPSCRVVRMRPCFLFKREASPEQRRIFAGPLVSDRLLGRMRLPLVPDLPGLQLQAMHTEDAARAYVQALHLDVAGAFNLAADPVVDAAALTEIFGGKAVAMPARPVRQLLAASWHARAVPAPPDLFDYVLRMPLMSSARARTELDWTPRHSAIDALEEFRTGLQDPAGFPTPPLAASRSH
jgi:UDP-glucose 4-epimerase